jgi:ethanolamine ammonia-lyase small subunit
MSNFVIPNPWRNLREYTGARIALGHCGVSMPTEEHLSFQMNHAMARDAVNLPLDLEKLRKDIIKELVLPREKEPLIVSSSASSRKEFLIRPDLGRILSSESREKLVKAATIIPEPDVAIIIGDGLSAIAMETNSIPFLKEFLPLIDQSGLTTAPLTLIQQCRVACGDDAASLFKARAAVILIGERPGLSSPDSMGIYLTWNPNPGKTTDAERNCISNIRPEGMDYRTAALKLAYLIEKAFRLELSGVGLKDDQNELTRDKKKDILSQEEE